VPSRDRVGGHRRAIALLVAALAAWPEVSLADRFAAATAESLRAGLYTTDGVLARAARRHGLACTLL
jgi:predicted nucleic acid-binding protein